MYKWLVISNCQTRGLARSLALRAPGLTVESCDVLAYRRDHDQWLARLGEFDKILVNPQFWHTDFEADMEGMDTLQVPAIYFPGGHPDETLIYVDGAPIDSSIGVYHSLIAWVGHVRGLDVAQTCRLFRPETYEALGYLDWWSRWRLYLIDLYKIHGGHDVAGLFNKWSRGRSFMYTSHHPRVECLFDLAGMILERHGIEAEHPNAMPEDDLVDDTCFPVYTEIATSLGFEGSYLFKPRRESRCLRLETFVEQSFAIYAGLDPARVTIEDNRKGLQDALLAL